MKASIDSDVINYYIINRRRMMYITIIILITTKEISLQLVHDKKLTDNICVDITTHNADAGIITYDDDGRCRCYHVTRTKS